MYYRTFHAVGSPKSATYSQAVRISRMEESDAVDKGVIVFIEGNEGKEKARM